MPVLLKNKSQAAGALYTAAIALYFVLSLVGGAILSVLPQDSFARTAISPLFAAVALCSVSFLSVKAYGAVGSESRLVIAKKSRFAEVIRRFSGIKSLSPRIFWRRF